MAYALAEFALSALLVIAAGIWLAHSADRIAEKTRLGGLIIGSLLLAGATSLPELTIGLHALRQNLPDIAVGDLVGSCLVNLLILAVADSVGRNGRKLMTPAAAGGALSGLLSLALAAVVGMFMLLERRGGFTVAGLGLGSISVVLTYLIGMRLVFYDHRAARRLSGTMDSGPVVIDRSLYLAIAAYVAAAVVILLAAPFVSSSSGKLAALSGLGETFFGTSIVALATSLPEVVTTVAAVRLKAFELAIGNIFGSNTFNLLLIAPFDLAWGGSLLSAVSITHAITCFWIVLVSTVVLLGQLYRVEKRILLIEPDAALVILLVVVAMLVIYLAR